MSPDPFGAGWSEFHAARARFLDGVRVGALPRAGGGALDRDGPMGTFLVTRRRGFGTASELERAAARSRAAGDRAGSGVRWIRTYALAERAGGLGTVCVFAADGVEAIHEHARRADLPIDEVIAVAGTMVVRPDPTPGGR